MYFDGSQLHCFFGKQYQSDNFDQIYTMHYTCVQLRPHMNLHAMYASGTHNTGIHVHCTCTYRCIPMHAVKYNTACT